MSPNRANQTTPGRKLITLAATAAISVIAVIMLGVMTAQAQSGTVPNLELSSANPGALTISWDAPDPAPSDYRIVWAKQDLGFPSYKAANEANRGNEYPSGEKRSITLTGLTGGETFKAMARSRYTSGGNNNGAWSGPWTDTVTTRVKDDPPAAPTGLNASEVTHNSVTLSWTAPTGGSAVTGYRVLRGNDANSLSAIAQDTGNTSTEYTDSTVAAETAYHYAVLALSQDGDGAQSDTISATTPAEPQPPSTPEPTPATAKEQKEEQQKDTRETRENACAVGEGATNISGVRTTSGYRSLKVEWHGSPGPFCIRSSTSTFFKKANVGMEVPTNSKVLERLTGGTTYTIQVKNAGSSWNADAAAEGTPLSTPRTPISSISCAPMTVDVGASVECTATVTQKEDGYYSQEWKTEPSGTPSTGDADTYTTKWDVGGTHDVSFEACNEGTCVSNSARITVIAPPPPTVSISCTPATVRAGVDVMCTATVSGKETAGYTQSWTSNGDTATGTADTFTTKRNSGPLSVSFKACNKGFCASDSEEITVIALPADIVVDCGTSRVAVGSAVTCKDSSSNSSDAGFTFTWTASDSASPSSGSNDEFKPEWSSLPVKTVSEPVTEGEVITVVQTVTVIKPEVSVIVCNSEGDPTAVPLTPDCKKAGPKSITVQETVRITSLICKKGTVSGSSFGWGSEITCAYTVNGRDDRNDITAEWSIADLDSCGEPDLVGASAQSGDEFSATLNCVGEKTITLTLKNFVDEDTEAKTIRIKRPTLTLSPSTMAPGEEITNTTATTIPNGRGVGEDSSPNTNHITLQAGQSVRLILPSPECDDAHGTLEQHRNYATIRDAYPGYDLRYQDYPYLNYWSSSWGRNPPVDDNGREIGTPNRNTGLRVDYDPSIQRMVLHGIVEQQAGIYPMYSTFEYGSMTWISLAKSAGDTARDFLCNSESQHWDIKITQTG